MYEQRIKFWETKISGKSHPFVLTPAGVGSHTVPGGAQWKDNPESSRSAQRQEELAQSTPSSCAPPVTCTVTAAPQLQSCPLNPSRELVWGFKHCQGEMLSHDTHGECPLLLHLPTPTAARLLRLLIFAPNITISKWNYENDTFLSINHFGWVPQSTSWDNLVFWPKQFNKHFSEKEVTFFMVNNYYKIPKMWQNFFEAFSH